MVQSSRTLHPAFAFTASAKAARTAFTSTPESSAGGGSIPATAMPCCERRNSTSVVLTVVSSSRRESFTPSAIDARSRRTGTSRIGAMRGLAAPSSVHSSPPRVRKSVFEPVSSRSRLASRMRSERRRLTSFSSLKSASGGTAIRSCADSLSSTLAMASTFSLSTDLDLAGMLRSLFRAEKSSSFCVHLSILFSSLIAIILRMPDIIPYRNRAWLRQDDPAIQGDAPFAGVPLPAGMKSERPRPTGGRRRSIRTMPYSR